MTNSGHISVIFKDVLVLAITAKFAQNQQIMKGIISTGMTHQCIIQADVWKITESVKEWELNNG